jgi:starch synthase
MPSRYEPCGLNQLYSLKYGTVPVVRATGGLADTVVGMSEATLANRTATGFAFDRFDTNELAIALGQAVTTFENRQDVWQQIVETGMRQDWSWRNSAAHYVELYERVYERHAQERSRLLAMK